MSQLQVSRRFERRESFWKTPAVRSASPTISGKKRKFSELDNTSHDNSNNNNNNKNIKENPSKKRRLLTSDEIDNIAKKGGFDASKIMIAVQESNGFCWFKRIRNDKSSIQNENQKKKYLKKYWNIDDNKQNNNNNNNSGILRELTKEELKSRAEKQKDGKHKLALIKAAKSRRHTAPVNVLNKLINDNNKKAKQLNILNKNKNKKKHKKNKKKPKHKHIKIKKKVIKYRIEKEIVKKKVHKKKRVLYKKKKHTKTIKITTEFGQINIPDFPVPDLKLTSWFYSKKDQPYISIQNFELSLIESFIAPLINTYGSYKCNNNNPLSFITKNVIQLLNLFKNNLSVIVNCIDYEVIEVPIKSVHNINPLSLTLSPMNGNNNQDDIRSKTDPSAYPYPNENAIKQIPVENDTQQDILEELKFYENELLLIDEYNKLICDEIEFTNNISQQLTDDEYLAKIFDFNLNDNDNDDNEDVNIDISSSLILNDNNFLNSLSSDIDRIYSEYIIDLDNIEYKQNKYEYNLNEIELKQKEFVKYIDNKSYDNIDDNDNDKINNLLESELKKNKLRMESINMNKHDKAILVFNDFIEANQNDNDNMDDLREFDFEIGENDTLNLNKLYRSLTPEQQQQQQDIYNNNNNNASMDVDE